MNWRNLSFFLVIFIFFLKAECSPPDLSPHSTKKKTEKIFRAHVAHKEFNQLEEGSKHWKGNLFVFDDRLVVKMGDEVISHCQFCDVKSDTYYNCANMDCNELFLSCQSCVEKMQGCCCETCTTVPVRREFKKAVRPKPYRKLPFEEKQRLRNSTEMNTFQVAQCD